MEDEDDAAAAVSSGSESELHISVARGRRVWCRRLDTDERKEGAREAGRCEMVLSGWGVGAFCTTAGRDGVGATVVGLPCWWGVGPALMRG